MKYIMYEHYLKFWIHERFSTSLSYVLRCRMLYINFLKGTSFMILLSRVDEGYFKPLRHIPKAHLGTEVIE